MSEYITECSWCGKDQTGNLTDTCTHCKKDGYLMDKLEP